MKKVNILIVLFIFQAVSIQAASSKDEQPKKLQTESKKNDSRKVVITINKSDKKANPSDVEKQTKVNDFNSDLSFLVGEIMDEEALDTEQSESQKKQEKKEE